MKKGLLKRIGLFTSVVGMTVAPVAAVVSCGASSIKMKDYKLLPTYTGQADQLISLGISPDYYPLQLNQTKPYKYLTNPALYMGLQKELNPSFATKFDAKIKELFDAIPEQGKSWWNMMAEKNDNTNPNSEYWTTKKGDFLLYEHYLLDDDKKILDKEQSPSYGVAIETNFRMSEDPFTRLPKEVIDQFMDNPDTTLPLAQELQKAFGLRDSSNAKVASMWNGNIPLIKGKEDHWKIKSPLFNDAYFAYIWHTQFLDNKQFQASSFNKFILNKDGHKSEHIFNSDNKLDDVLARLFEKATIPETLGELTKYGTNYVHQGNRVKQTRHHPIYDAQSAVGVAPMFEGARRDNMLYLYNLASQLTHKVKGQNLIGEPVSAGSKADKEAKYLQSVFKGDIRLPKMETAFINASSIASNFDTRLKHIKKYFEDINVNGKTFAFVTIAPGGGVSTIQTNSKYSFLYDRLGLNYPLPNDMDTAYAHGIREADVASANLDNQSTFSMDDNGWFWNIGDGSRDFKNLNKFEGKADFGVLAIRPAENEWLKSTTGTADRMTLDGVSTTGLTHVNYDLWNEGLKTPFVINMILDQMIEKAEAYAKTQKTTIDTKSQDRINASNWGTYWTSTFVA